MSTQKYDEWEKHLADIKKAHLLDDDDDGLITIAEAVKNEVEAFKKLYSRFKNFIKERYG